MGLPRWLVVKSLPASVGDVRDKDLIPGPQLLFFFFPFIFISWRLITLQYCSGFFHTLT